MKPLPHDQTINSRAVLTVAVPVMLSNVSTPLIGAIDTAAVGQIPDPAQIGAVAVASLVFTFVFWAFGFLRMGTTGLTAQALGAGDQDEQLACLGRALLASLIVGLGLIGLQWPIREAAFALLDGSPRVETLARDYFDIRIWAAPATLANYALLGWYIGLGRTRTALLLQIILNFTNAALDALFVLGFGWGVSGVALGTLIAEYTAVAAGMFIAWQSVRESHGHLTLQRVANKAHLLRMIAVNRDIMLRSLALMFVFVWFVSRGAEQGEVILAANAVLMHFVSVSAYFLDGLSFAAEALVGRAIGAGKRMGLEQAAKLTTVWAAGIAVLLSILLYLTGPMIVDVLTVDPDTRIAARTFIPWAAMAPFIGVWAFQLDAIFIGATRTTPMRNAMLVSLTIYLLAWWALSSFGNHGLWAAFQIHYVARAITLWRHYPALVRSVSG